MILIDKNGEVRIPWRVVSLFALIFSAAFIISKTWRAAGLPGQRDSSEWQVFSYAALMVGAVLLIILLLLRAFEKRGLDAIWLPLQRSAVGQTLLGTLLGCVPILLLVGIAVLAGYGSIAPGSASLSAIGGAMLPALGAVLLFAALEELVLRGYVFRQISLARNPLFAAAITGVLFGLIHSGNPGANWQGLVFTAIGGFLMGLLLIRSGSLWLLIGYHFGWNACSGNLFGLMVSGMDVQNTVRVTTLSGSDWLTGGSYGFESSLPAVLCELAFLSALLLYLHKIQRGQSRLRAGSEPFQSGL